MVGGAQLLRPAARRPGLHHPRGRAGPDPRRLRRRQNGARLPTGVNNVVATYRYGSGAAAPPAGSLTVVLQPQPGLRSIAQPGAPSAAGPTPTRRPRSASCAPIGPDVRPGRSRSTISRPSPPGARRDPGQGGRRVRPDRAAAARHRLGRRRRRRRRPPPSTPSPPPPTPTASPRSCWPQAVAMTLSLTIVYDPRYDGRDRARPPSRRPWSIPTPACSASTSSASARSSTTARSTRPAWPSPGSWRSTPWISRHAPSSPRSTRCLAPSIAAQPRRRPRPSRGTRDLLRPGRPDRYLFLPMADLTIDLEAAS